MKKAFSLLLSIVLFAFSAFYSISAATFTEELDCKSAILIEASTMKVLYEKNADQPYPPASVTKIMTLLLVCEAIDNGTVKMTDYVPVSEKAAGMGGSQVYLKVGEEMTLEDMLKSVIVSSANDCAVALAEYVSGSEAAFAVMMNERAKELGMNNTVFENVTGLDDTVTNHVTSARDIAIMSAELLKHEYITDYSTIWMDTIRNGQFGLTNTNRLIRFYKGANGLKTGMTSKAGFCISATAERGGMQLIAVIMGSPSRDVRNGCATDLLDFGFANYSLYHVDESGLYSVKLKGGYTDEISVCHDDFSALMKTKDLKNVKYETRIPETLYAPLHSGEKVGSIDFYCGEEMIGSVDIKAGEDAPKIGFFGVFAQLLKKFLMNT